MRMIVSLCFGVVIVGGDGGGGGGSGVGGVFLSLSAKTIRWL